MPFLEFFERSNFPLDVLENIAVAMPHKEPALSVMPLSHTSTVTKSASFYARGTSLLLITTLFISGCAELSQERTSALDSSHNAPASMQATYDARIIKVRDELRAACFSQELQSYYRMTPCLASGITRSMMRDNTRITRDQRTAAQKVFVLTKELNAETLRIMEESGTPELLARATQARSALPIAEALQADLLEGRITWGEYNTRRRALHTQSTGESQLREETEMTSLSSAQPPESKEATNGADESED